MNMVKKIFIFSFITACVLQWVTFTKLPMADFSLWARQAEYVQTGNPIEFDFLQAYGHPGGSIIEGVSAIHNVFGVSHENSLMIFLVLLDGLAIAGACTICFLLSKNHLWWPVVLSTLSLNYLYEASTPPSTLASLLIVFLCLLSLYLYEKHEKGEIKNSLLVFWSILAGFIISTRIDIGTIMVISFLIFIGPKISRSQILWILFGIGISFAFFDPFMWFMPIKHMGDLIFKVIYHYEYFPINNKMSLLSILNISAFLITSVFFSTIFLLLKEKIKSPIPQRLIYILLIATTVIYTIFLTSQYQSSRYFLPLISIWEVFLPLFIFSLTSKLRPALSKISNIFFVSILILYPIASVVSFILIGRLYSLNLLPK
jgi:hypothetical protein